MSMLQEEYIKCPLRASKLIDDTDCMVTQDVVDCLFKPSVLAEEVRNKPHFREICKKCPNYGKYD